MAEPLKPWYAVATPHKAIRDGGLRRPFSPPTSWPVIQGTAPDVYLDPEEFFRKTYMTVGLTTIIERVGRALRGDIDTGDRMISLQATLGGG